MLSDGKAGDELQCLAVVRELGLEPVIRRVAPRPPWVWAMPHGPIDPRERPSAAGSPIEPPFPDLLVASGRRTVPYVRAVRKLSGGHTFTVILKDPRTGAGTADLIWVPEHDRLHGANVIRTLTSPHGLSPAIQAAARAAARRALLDLPAPRAAVLVGGDSRHHRFTSGDRARLVGQLDRLADCGVGLMGTTSRRTPAELRDALAGLFERRGGFLWDGQDSNPYAELMGLADVVVVTADSTNMVGEAAATGRPVLVFSPSGGHRKIDALLSGLRARGIVHDFAGRLAGSAYPPLNSTPVIAAAIGQALAARRQAEAT
ncbi:mitochondrial fission ELM1 family protein [Chelatococcus reniformis]|uniref:Nucleoside-diphosphate sugar epimerase n=1 Tax=Chelatococcus reniformis TaxID=1494448 RepID=A0A916UQA8_9HYPH|nr:mitochondrial fission ELM1 family protein [Chelatococcus reniformis]GGC82653.1 hypothetical protein GCM10010994_45690 [Chelatococcus reniformis]